ncbi:MAG TPA: T9SS type A sorting domain-containing protein [bacterium]|jgi:hypothetical protein
MRVFVTVLVLLALLAGASTVLAQSFCVALLESDQQLDSLCDGAGHPIADGTIIEIWQDKDPAGIGPEDSLANACTGDNCPPGLVNLNQFFFDAEYNGLLPGQFYMDDRNPQFCSYGILPTPNRFYLRICLPGRHYVSNVFSPVSGASDYEVGPWQCIEQPCAGCLPPPPPTAFSATDNSTCFGVNMTWNYPDNVDQLDAFFLYRDEGGNTQEIAQVGPAVRSYTDSSAASGVPYTFSIKARRNCGTSIAFSAQPTDPGMASTAPQVATSLTVQNACSTVTVTWSFASIAGTQRFVVRRDADSVGFRQVVTPGILTFSHTTLSGAAGQYTVVGWNSVCGYGLPSAPVTGQALQRPAQVQNVSATDGVCDSTIITWTDVTGETAYQVWRSNADGTSPSNLVPAGLPANTVRYRDITGTIGTSYRYWVIAANTCGPAAASVYDLGVRFQTPGTPLNFAATDSTLCDRVRLTWSNVASNQGFKVMRTFGATTDTLGPVPQDTLHFEDMTAAGGVNYTYSVLAFNGCGSSAPSLANAGSRRGLPGQVTGVVASDNVCAGVDVTWNNVAGEDSFRVLRDGVQVGHVGANALTFTDVTSVPGVVYTYTVVAANACGSADPSTGDAGMRRELPAQVAGVTASQGLCTGVNIAWQTQAGVDSFIVYRDAVRIGATGPLATSFSDVDIHDAVNHNYTVAGTNVCGIGPVSVAAQGRRNPAPPAITGLAATSNQCAAVVLTWTAASGADSLQVRRDGSRIGVAAGAATTFSDADATPGTTYSYVVVSYNSCGIGEVPTAVQGVRPAPAVVQGLTATTNRCDIVRLTWQPVSGPVQYYRIFQNSILIDIVDGTVTTRDIHPGGPGNWSYAVTQYSAECGESARSDTANGIMQTQPTPATNIAATINRCDGVLVSWTHGTGAIDGYIVRRGGVNIDTTASSATSFLDTAAPEGNSAYSVRPYSLFCTNPSFPANVTGTRTPMPVAPASVAATTDECNRVHVTWNDLPDETGYHVYRDSVQVAVLAAGVVSFYDSNATVGNHHYAVVGINTCGEGTRSAAVTGTYNAIPSQVTTLAATQDSCTSIYLTWTDLGTAERYRIFRGGTLLDSVNQGVGTFHDATLTPGIYVYAIEPVNFCGAGPVSANVDGRVQSIPAEVAGLAATNDQCHITVTWTDLSNEVTYELFRDAAPLATVAQNVVTYVDSTATVGLHEYAIQAVNQCGTGTASGTVSGERQGPPTETSSVTAPDSACGEATLTWTAVGDVTGYLILRNAVRVDSVGGSVTTLPVSAQPGTYAYTVQGINACGTGPVSEPVSIRFKPVPAQVTGVEASTTSCSDIVLTWSNMAEETGYHIYRETVLIGTIGRDTLTFTDNTSGVGSFTYQIGAFNECGEGVLSAAATGIHRGIPGTVTNFAASDTMCTNITVTWTNVADNEGYILQRTNPTPVVEDSLGADVTTFVDNTVTAGITYTYRILARNACGRGSFNTPQTGVRTDVLAQVQNVAASTNRCDAIMVSWSNIVGETRFWIYRDGTAIDSVAADVLQYLDANVAIGAPHAYTVSARNGCGLSPISAPANGSRMQGPQIPAFLTARDSCNSVFLRWGAAAGDVDTFRVFRGATNIANVTAATFTYLDVTVPGTYVYTVLGHSTECGDGSATPATNGTSHASAGVPAALQAAAAVCDSVVLTWNASPGETSRYRVFRDGVLIDSTTALRYADRNLPNSANHSYTVAGFNPWCGQSAQSTPVTGHVLQLVRMNDVATTLRCGASVHIVLQHCSAIPTAEFFLSLNGGAYRSIATVSPVDSFANVTMPDTNSANYPNSHLMLVSHRGARVDTVYSNTFILDCTDGVDQLDPGAIPTDFFLSQNYPNPFNPSTVIRFGVPRTAEVKVAVYDVLGRQVASLIDGAMQPGVHSINWDCRSCPSGMYLVRMETGDRVMMRKMLLMK